MTLRRDRHFCGRIPASAITVLLGLWAATPASAEVDTSDLDVAAPPRLEALAVAPSAVVAPAPPRRTIHEGSIVRGKTLSSLLRSQGVKASTVAEIAKALKGHFNFRRARPGHEYRLVADGEGRLVEFRYRISKTKGWYVARHDDGFHVLEQAEELEARPTRIAGVITSTLYESITHLGEDGQLARDFADIFAWDVDFQRTVQPGDSYQILYERLYRKGPGGGEYLRPGRILAARFVAKSGSHTAVYFEAEPGRGGYYRPNGSSVEGAFLMSPVRHARITSHYSAARRHPILKVTRRHPGIDYAAAAGTPVWAVANGTIVHRSWAGGSGNLVKVKHDNGYVSSYAHLSRYAKDLRIGDRVKQKQVIGYVGQTGLATGPHVCFRVKKDGQYVNPATLRAPSGSPIEKEDVPRFMAQRDLLLAQLDTGRRLAEARP